MNVSKIVLIAFVIGFIITGIVAMDWFGSLFHYGAS